MVQANLFRSFAKAYHRKAYGAISPTRPELSAAGKTVVVTGGNQGIGYAIASSFAAAGAAHVVLIARRADVLASAKTQLESEQHGSTRTAIHTYVATVDDATAMADVFAKIRADTGAEPDVLVLNAAHVAHAVGDVAGEVEGLQRSMAVNVVGNMNLVREFAATTTTTSVNAGPKTVLDISSAAAHIHSPQSAYAYPASKIAFSRVMGLVQREADAGSPKWPRGFRCFSLHPGGIYTETARAAGLTKDDFPWNEPELPGNMAVWLAMCEDADFLRGRFVWANWDVEELVARRTEIEEQDLLRIGLYGAEGTYPIPSHAGTLRGVFDSMEKVDGLEKA